MWAGGNRRHSATAVRQKTLNLLQKQFAQRRRGCWGGHEPALTDATAARSLLSSAASQQQSLDHTVTSLICQICFYLGARWRKSEHARLKPAFSKWHTCTAGCSVALKPPYTYPYLCPFHCPSQPSLRGSVMTVMWLFLVPAHVPVFHHHHCGSISVIIIKRQADGQWLICRAQSETKCSAVQDPNQRSRAEKNDNDSSIVNT